MSFFSCFFLVNSKRSVYKKINKKHRIDFWIGIGTGTWFTAVLMTVIGYLSADLLNKDMLIGLAIVNPVYFFFDDDGSHEKLYCSIATYIMGALLF